MIQIAIIDDGINQKQLKVNSAMSHYMVDDTLNIIQTTGTDKVSTHATHCAQTLYKYEQNFHLHSIKVLNENDMTCHIKKLITALKWCISKHIQLIHLSIGTTCNKDFKIIEELINELQEQGTIIVAACDNNDRLTYPAALPYVIGVRTDRTNTIPKGFYHYQEHTVDGIQIIANCDLEEDMNCNSYVAPFITAAICGLMNKGLQAIEQIKYELSIASIYTPDICKLRERQHRLSDRISIESPNILLCSTNNDVSNEVLTALVALFRSEDYHSIGFADGIQTNFTEGLYPLKTCEYANNITDIIYIHYFITRPDIMLTAIHIQNEKQIKDLIKNELNDIFIYLESDCTEEDQKNREKYPFDFIVDQRNILQKDYSGIYQNIIKIFTESEKAESV